MNKSDGLVQKLKSKKQEFESLVEEQKNLEQKLNNLNK